MDKDKAFKWESKLKLIGVEAELLYAANNSIYLKKYKANVSNAIIDIPEYIIVDTYMYNNIFEGLRGDIKLHIHGEYRGNNCTFFRGNKELSSVEFGLYGKCGSISLKEMFFRCNSLKWVNIVQLNAEVVNIDRIFSECRNIQSIDIKCLDLSRCSSADGAFNNCELLEDLDTSNMDTGNMRNMKSMFRGCKCLKELDVSKFNMGNAIWADEMFQDMYSISRLDVSNWEAPNLRSIRGMFYECKQLKMIDLGNINEGRSEGTLEISGVMDDCISLVAIRIGRGVNSLCKQNIGRNKIYGVQSLKYVCGLPLIDFYDSNYKRVTPVHMLDKSMDKIFEEA